MTKKTQRVHFVVFGDSTNWKSAKNRLRRQIKASVQNSEITMLDEKWLESELRMTNHLDFIRKNPRGFGNWLWKPISLIVAMNSDPNCNYFVYLDAGCELNWNQFSELRFYEYLDFVDKTGGLFFELENFEREHTSRMLLEAFQATETSERQVMATAFLLANNLQSKSFLEEWFKWMTVDNYKYLVESKNSDGGTQDEFQHRFDQSILSLLVHNSPFMVIKDETYWSPEWLKGIKFPIWASRNRLGISVTHSYIIKLPHRIVRKIYILIKQRIDR